MRRQVRPRQRRGTILSQFSSDAPSSVSSLEFYIVASRALPHTAYSQTRSGTCPMGRSRFYAPFQDRCLRLQGVTIRLLDPVQFLLGSFTWPADPDGAGSAPPSVTCPCRLPATRARDRRSRPRGRGLSSPR